MDRRPPPENNPITDDHILCAITVVALTLLHTGDTWGLGRWWSSLDLVKENPVLR